MLPQNFTAIARGPGKCIFVHRDNVELLRQYGYGAKIHCMHIEFNSGKISEPLIVDRLLKFGCYPDISSEGERQIMADLVRETLSEEEIKKLNQKFEEIKFQD